MCVCVCVCVCVYARVSSRFIHVLFAMLQLVTTGRDLRSTHLQELAQQVENSTKEYCYQYERLKEEVERRESRLLQIEKEQDARSRALKQRE